MTYDPLRMGLVMLHACMIICCPLCRCASSPADRPAHATAVIRHLPACSGSPPTRPPVQCGAQLVAVHGKQPGCQSAPTTSWLGPAGQHHLGACRFLAGNDRRSSNCACRWPPVTVPLPPGPMSLPIPIRHNVVPALSFKAVSLPLRIPQAMDEYVYSSLRTP